MPFNTRILFTLISAVLNLGMLNFLAGIFASQNQYFAAYSALAVGSCSCYLLLRSVKSYLENIDSVTIPIPMSTEPPKVKVYRPQPDDKWGENPGAGYVNQDVPDFAFGGTPPGVIRPLPTQKQYISEIIKERIKSGNMISYSPKGMPYDNEMDADSLAPVFSYNGLVRNSNGELIASVRFWRELDTNTYMTQPGFIRLMKGRDRKELNNSILILKNRQSDAVSWELYVKNFSEVEEYGICFTGVPKESFNPGVSIGGGVQIKTRSNRKVTELSDEDMAKILAEKRDKK